MSKLAAPLAVAALVVGLAAMSPRPALAQASGDRVNEIIVFGTDPCPRSTDDEVVVCTRWPRTSVTASRNGFAKRDSRSSARRGRTRCAASRRVGRTGIQSCSPVGPAGYTGCMEQMINQARDENRESSSQQTAPEQ